MDRWLGKTFVLLLVLGIGIFYGITISKEGIEHIHGPLPDEALDDSAAVEAEVLPAASDQPSVQRMPAAVQSEPETLLMRLVHKLSGLLRLLADGLIRILVGLGEAVLS